MVLVSRRIADTALVVCRQPVPQRDDAVHLFVGQVRHTSQRDQVVGQVFNRIVPWQVVRSNTLLEQQQDTSWSQITDNVGCFIEVPSVQLTLTTNNNR